MKPAKLVDNTVFDKNLIKKLLDEQGCGCVLDSVVVINPSHPLYKRIGEVQEVISQTVCAVKFPKMDIIEMLDDDIRPLWKCGFDCEKD